MVIKVDREIIGKNLARVVRWVSQLPFIDRLTIKKNLPCLIHIDSIAREILGSGQVKSHA